MNITITGPRSVGKSTISKLVAKKLKLKYISSDEIGDKALKKHGGLDKATKSGEIKKVIEKRGYALIKQVYLSKRNFVFDLSGGAFSYKRIPKISEEVRKIAKEKSFVVGLLPSRCVIVSIWLLFFREIKRAHFKDSKKLFLFWKTMRNYLRFPSIFREATNLVIYTRNKAPERIAKEIVNKIRIFEK